MRYLLQSGSIFFTLLLAGCVHMSQEQCLNTNWQQLGYDDGAAGSAKSNLTSEIADCEKFKINVNTQAYAKGWQAGLKKVYCSPTHEQGLQAGNNGEPYENILNRSAQCTSAGVSLSLGAYKAGYANGLQHFCSFENGKNAALQGQQPPALCKSAAQHRYMEGWRTGLQKFCSYENGMNAALEGNSPLDVCNQPSQQRYLAGWNAGLKKFCSNTQNSFSLGKEGKPYPSICPGNIYYAFKAEYDRGNLLHQKVADLHAQIGGVNHTIDDLAKKYHFRGTADARGFELGDDLSPAANSAIYDVKNLLTKRDNLQGQLNQLEVTR